MKSSSIATPTPDLQQYQLGRNLAEISDLEQRTKIPSENKKYNDTIQPACSATETSTHTKIPVCIDGLSIGVSGIPGEDPATPRASQRLVLLFVFALIPATQ